MSWPVNVFTFKINAKRFGIQNESIIQFGARMKKKVRFPVAECDRNIDKSNKTQLTEFAMFWITPVWL